VDHPASLIHGELKVVETNRKGLSREVDPPASGLFQSKRELLLKSGP
jgi:hypothetical protein